MSLEQGETFASGVRRGNVIRHQNCIDSLLPISAKTASISRSVLAKKLLLAAHGHSRRLRVLGHAITQG